MKAYSKVLAVLILFVAGAVASESAMARGGGGGWGHSVASHGGSYRHGGGYGHGGGHGRGYGYGGRVGFGIALGIPFYGMGYYPAPYYSYPRYAYPAPAYVYPAPAVAPSGAYIEQGYARSAPAAQQDWYYCADSNAYYPQIRECPAGWQRVPAQPSR